MRKSLVAIVLLGSFFVAFAGDKKAVAKPKPAAPCYIFDNELDQDVMVVFGAGGKPIPFGQKPAGYLVQKKQKTAIIPIEQKWVAAATQKDGKRINVLMSSRGSTILLTFVGYRFMIM